MGLLFHLRPPALPNPYPTHTYLNTTIILIFLPCDNWDNTARSIIKIIIVPRTIAQTQGKMSRPALHMQAP
jgi:hypothetical protein